MFEIERDLNIEIERPEQIDSGFSIIADRDLFITEDTQNSFHGGPNRRTRKFIAEWSLLATVIDFTLVASVALLLNVLFQKAFLKITGSFLSQSKQEFFLLLSISNFLLLTVYFVFARLFTGSTIGEWTCGLRLGTFEEQSHKRYLPKIIMRLFLQGITGFVTFPTISLFKRKDVLGKFVELSVIPKKQV